MASGDRTPSRRTGPHWNGRAALIVGQGPRSVSFVIICMALGLAGCGGGETVQQALGYEQTGPDEMAVIKRPPLTVPPDYNLRPPRPGGDDAGGNAASDAARRTLIGPSSSADGVSEPASEARAILTGGEDGDDGSGASAASSDGQQLLVSRTDRVERDLDALSETRAENRVDGALLRRLLAFDPAERAAADDTTAVQLVRRQQTPIETTPATE